MGWQLAHLKARALQPRTEARSSHLIGFWCFDQPITFPSTQCSDLDTSPVFRVERREKEEGERSSGSGGYLWLRSAKEEGAETFSSFHSSSEAVYSREHCPQCFRSAATVVAWNPRTNMSAFCLGEVVFLRVSHVGPEFVLVVDFGFQIRIQRKKELNEGELRRPSCSPEQVVQALFREISGDNNQLQNTECKSQTPERQTS